MDIRKKYHMVATEWERTEYNWTPVQFSNYFETQKARKSEVKVLNVSQMIDLLIERFNTHERFKNGKLVIGSLNAREYHFLKRSLSEFTKQKYKKALSAYFFADIDEDFISSYAVFLQMKGTKIQKIESIDRSKFTPVENIHIDIYLLCFYSGGMANIDAAHLTKNCIVDGMIAYERMKFPKEARVPNNFK